MRQFIWGEGFVSILHGALSSPLIRKQSVNCEVKVKTKNEKQLTRVRDTRRRVSTNATQEQTS